MYRLYLNFFTDEEILVPQKYSKFGGRGCKINFQWV